MSISFPAKRQISTAQYQRQLKAQNRKVLIYATSLVVGVVGVTYASVPLYKGIYDIMIL